MIEFLCPQKIFWFIFDFFQGFAPTAEKDEKDEDDIEEPKVEEEKPKPIFTTKLVPISLLNRSLDYRLSVEKLQSCKLLNSLTVIRQPMGLQRILVQTNISDHKSIEFDPFYYSHYKQINEISMRWKKAMMRRLRDFLKILPLVHELIFPQNVCFITRKWNYGYIHRLCHFSWTSGQKLGGWISVDLFWLILINFK